MPAVVVPPFAREGLAFRAWQGGDLDRLAALVTDADVMARAGGRIPRDEVAGLLDRYLREDDPSILVALCVHDEHGDHVGSGQLVRSPRLEHAVELGYLVRPAHQGRGHGARIARALVSLAHAHFPGAPVLAVVEDGHAASIRVLEKAGLSFSHREEDTESVGEPRLLVYRRSDAR